MNNKIEKEFVPYQIAVDMKSIGFNEPCVALYKFKKFKYNTKDCNELVTFYNRDGNIISYLAPTFSQCFRWFREKNIFHCIAPSSEIGKYHVGYFDKEWTLLKNNNEVPIKYLYEDAELECLKKLIEIVKTNKT